MVVFVIRPNSLNIVPLFPTTVYWYMNNIFLFFIHVDNDYITFVYVSLLLLIAMKWTALFVAGVGWCYGV